MFLLICLSIFVAYEGFKAKRSMEKQERTWITNIDFIGGMPGVHGVFESYEEVLGINSDELMKLRKENIENRRFSTPYISQISKEDKAMYESINTRSKSNFEKARFKKTSEEEEAEFYLKVLNYPHLFYEHLPPKQQSRDRSGSMSSFIGRFSLSSGSAGSSSPSIASPGLVNTRPERRGTVATCNNQLKQRTLDIDTRSNSVGHINLAHMNRRKKPSVIHETSHEI